MLAVLFQPSSIMLTAKWSHKGKYQWFKCIQR